MKSTFALWWAVNMNVPTLYLSADCAPTTALSRSAAMVTGDPRSSIAEAIDALSGSPGASWYYQEQVSDLNIAWSFDPKPTLDDIWCELDAYVEIHDSYPELIVADNLMDIEVGGEGYEPQTYAMGELHILARTTGACVMVLHHCRENPDGDKNFNPGWPPPRWHIKNKVDQKPEIILTVAHDKEHDLYRVAAVKVRDGESDEGAKNPIVLRVDPSICQFYPHSDWRG